MQLRSKVLVLPLLAAAAMTMTMRDVRAHGEARSLTPAHGAVLTVAPAQVMLEFSDPIERVRLDVWDESGVSVLAGRAEVDGRRAIAALNAGLAVGTYTAHWQIMEEDGAAAVVRQVFHVVGAPRDDTARVIVNGKEVPLPTPLMVMDGWPVLDPTALAVVTGKKVEWDGAAKQLTISDPPAAHMSHPVYIQPAGSAEPSLKLTVLVDKKGGFNLHLATENWTWAPEHVNEEVVANEGHAHIYVNGVQVARHYGPWFLLANLTPGVHLVHVTLNANDHADYADHKGEVIEAMAMILVRPDGTRSVLQQ